MKSFKLEANEMLQRNELKSVLGGHSACSNNGEPSTFRVNCPDGRTFKITGCPEHLELLQDDAVASC